MKPNFSFNFRKNRWHDIIATLQVIIMCVSQSDGYAQLSAADSISNLVPGLNSSALTDSLIMMTNSSGDGEVNVYARPDPLYKTPEAYAFQEYGKFGTEGSNGSIDISIPIHTVSCRDLQIPIVLHYGGTGIRVSDEASWVGLGWDLSVGGCINYVAAGQYDAYERNALWSNYKEILNMTPSTTFQKQLDVYDYSVMQDLILGLGERDFYSVNILGRSFLFFINPDDGKPSIIGANDEDFHISTFGADGWLVRDMMGYSYEFSEREYCLYDGLGMRNSAWYLSSISTPEGITATFKYGRTYVKGLPRAYQWYDVQRTIVASIVGPSLSAFYSFPNYGSGTSWSNCEISKPWLMSVTTDNQTVNFGLSDRTDYQGAKKIDTIKVSDINGDTAYQFQLNYGTFAHSTVGGSCPDISSHLVTDSHNGERLKLLSLSQLSNDRTDSLSYKFTYNERYPLPLKTSAAIDFWGYYNGHENLNPNPEMSDSRTLIPSLSDCTIGYKPLIDPTYASLSIPGAFRFSDSERILSGSLATIEYPTGGKSVFTFEPHRFLSTPVYPLNSTGYSDVTVSVEDNNYPADDKNPGPVTNRKVGVARETTGFLTVTFSAMSGKKLRDLQQAGTSITLQPMASPAYKKIIVTLDSCSNVDLESAYHTETIAFELDAVSYMFISDFPSSLEYGDGYVKASLSFRVLNPGIESGGAGLRIAAIDNYDENEKLIGRREFSYEDTNGATSGRRIIRSRPMECLTKYVEHVLLRDAYGDIKAMINRQLAVIKINSDMSGELAITGAMSKGAVAYTRMVETEKDGDGNVLRVIESEYDVHQSWEVFEGMHLLTSIGGGEIRKKTVRDGDGNIAQTVKYEYKKFLTKTLKCNIWLDDQFYEYVHDWEMRHLSPRYLLRIYPYTTYWRALSSTLTQEHTEGGVTERRCSYTYNGINHLVSEETVTSGDSGIRTTYTYPVDYTTYPYSTMSLSDYFIRGIPVETSTFELADGVYTLSRRTRNSYLFKPAKAAMLQLERVQESIAGGTLNTRESFTYSDEDATLVGVVEDTAKTRTYLWSYKHSCPVAVIEGASYSEVESWLGKNLINSLSNESGDPGLLLSQVRSGLNGRDVVLTTFTHKPLVGITSETRPNGERITYEYDIFNRLSRIKDSNGDVIDSFSYNYK